MISTLPEDLQKVRDRLLNFDSEVLNGVSNEEPGSNFGLPDASYTASLAEVVFSGRPDSRFRGPSLLPLSTGFSQQFDGSFYESDPAREKHQNQQISEALSSPTNDTIEWAKV
jgi:hypothetical protein